MLIGALRFGAILLLAGCTSIPLPAAYLGPQPLPAHLAAYYEAPQPPTEVTTELIRDHRRYREFLVRFPLAVGDFEPTEPVVELEWFESTIPGRHPAIVFSPILGGDYPLERGICRFLVRHGLHVAMIHRKTLKISPEHPVEHLESLLRQGTLRIRHVVSWLETHDRVDPDRLGSFGISMGGIAGVISAAVEPRLRVHVAALPGGGIPDIVMTSKDPLLTKPIARYLARNDLDRETMEARLRQSVRTDPLLLAPYVDARELLVFIALADRTIGRANALRLWRALGRPKAVFFPTGHYTAYLLLPYLKYASLRFYRERFGILDPL